MSKKIELRVLLDLNFETERQRLQQSWNHKPDFRDLLLQFIHAIETSEHARVSALWQQIEDQNPDKETRPVEYLDPAIVSYWMLLGKPNIKDLQGYPALHVFETIKNDRNIVHQSVITIEDATLRIDP